MQGTTTVKDLNITGNLYLNGVMLTQCGQSSTSPCYVYPNVGQSTTSPSYSSLVNGLSSTSPVYVSTGVSYHDWIFVNIILIFLMSFLAIGYLASVFKPKK